MWVFKKGNTLWCVLVLNMALPSLASGALLYNHHISCLKKLFKVLGKYERTSHEKALPQIYASVYRKIYHDPDYSLSSEELFFLRDEKHIEQFRKNIRPVQRLKQFVNSYDTVSMASAKKAEFWTIFDKILKNPDAQLSSTEAEIVRTLEDQTGIGLAHIRDISREFGPSIKRLHTLGMASAGLYLLIATGGFALSLFDEKVVYRDDWDLEDPMGEDEFEIIYLSPASHTDLRIGNEVYTFGPGIIYKKSLESYYRSTSLSSPLYGSSTRVRIRVSEEEVAALRDYLEGELGKFYLFGVMAYTCIAATHRAVERNTQITIPAGIDRSSVLAEAYFKVRHMLGDENISAIKFYSYSGSYIKDKFLDGATSLIDSFFMTALLIDHVIAAQLDYLPNSIRVLPWPGGDTP